MDMDEVPAGGPTTGLLVTYSKCLQAADEASWDEWEDLVHVPALCGDAGPWVATRFELTERPRPGMPGIGFTHVTIYELDDVDPAAQAARALAADDALRARGRSHPAHVRGGGRRVHRPRTLRREAGTVRRAAWPHPHPRALQQPDRAKRSGTRGTTPNTCPTCSRAARSAR